MLGQAQHGHHLARHGDVEAVLARDTVRRSAQPVGDAAQLPVVHVHAALPCDAPRVDPQGVALLDVVIDHRGQQVVRRADRVHIAGKMQVDVLHRHHLRIAAARRAALDAEHRPQRRLPQRHHGLFPDAAQPVRQPDRGGRFALARRGRRDGGDQDQPTGRSVLLQKRQRQFRLIPPVGRQIVRSDADLLGDLIDPPHPAALRDLDIG